VRCGLIILTLTAMLSRAQVPPPPDAAGPTPADGPPVTVHGVVVDAATGNPLSGALVEIDSLRLGALSDSGGRFSIAGVPSGLQIFQVIKPGFHSPGKSYAAEVITHTVRAAADATGLLFSLAPDNSISGHVRFSSGGRAGRIGLVLLEQLNVNGRVTWRSSAKHTSTPAGEFRFYGLEDGTYSLMTIPEFENAPASEPACNADSPGEMDGYAPIFYRGSGGLDGAAPIAVSGGQNAEADLSLNRTRYYFVQISIENAPAGDDWAFDDSLFDRSGQVLPYSIHEEKDHTVCAYLPDGAYTLVDDASPTGGPPAGQKPQGADSSPLTGELEFSVEGHAERGLRVRLAKGKSTPVYVHFQPGPPKPPAPPKPGPNQPPREEADYESLSNFSAARANAVSDHDSTETVADRINDTTYAFAPSPPGAYWLRGEAGMPGTCLGPVTAAGQDLAQSPWMVGSAGTGAAIDVVLRTDCATLTFSMPPALPEEAAGEGTSIYIYAVPEFSTVADLLSAQLDQYGDRSKKLEDLTPGTYRVFAFRTPHSLEYHNPAALAQLGTGKEITLDAGASAAFVVQEIAP
jgi:hypothetical protein